MSSSSSSSPPSVSERLTQFQQKITFLSDKNINALYKPLILTGLFLFIFYILLSNRQLDQPPQYLARFRHKTPFYDDNKHKNNNTIDSNTPTNISHIVIGIAGSVGSWGFRKPYIEAWWQPNVTKGYLFLDQEPKGYLTWSNSSPPYRVSEDTSKYNPYNKHPMRSAIRMVRVILETFRELHEGVRWYVMADDDTVLFLDNLVEVLSRYDHRKYFYIGENSESVLSNFDNSFEMAFGGGGYALSYPLAEALAKNMDVCIKRYPFVYGSDHLLQSCVADLGVSLTHEKGFHQIDLHNDLSGFLTSHPQAPTLSLHHLDKVEPLFPSMNRSEALNHLMKAAKIDQSRLFQQTICYKKSKNWSFSVAWGYSVQVYEKIISPSVLEIHLETFSAWRKPPKHPFMFNTRWPSKNPCDMPHMFFLESVEKFPKKNQIITSYIRGSPRTLPPCPLSLNGNGNGNGNSSSFVRDIAKIIVVTSSTKFNAMDGNRRECCDVLDQVEKNITMIKYRACMKNEMVGVD